MNSSLDPCAVRPAVLSDADELARLFSLLGHPTQATDVATRWKVWTTAGNMAIVAANVDGFLTGVVTITQMVVLHRPMPVGRITLLVVDESMRGRGIGRRLVAAAERTLADAGCGLLEITSHVRLREAHEFYKHLGYKKTSIRLAKPLSAAP